MEFLPPHHFTFQYSLSGSHQPDESYCHLLEDELSKQGGRNSQDNFSCNFFKVIRNDISAILFEGHQQAYNRLRLCRASGRNGHSHLKTGASTVCRSQIGCYRRNIEKRAVLPRIYTEIIEY